mmetsp:Transcript_10060/g.24625  ORF Transcript_10060/g.24625 Transcript_10060/m.24625 type:complete len:739 (-) Transcript_10060:31-2247(-)
MSSSVMSSVSWAVVGIMNPTAPAPEPEPAEEGFSPWPFILLTAIVGFSITFDLLKEAVEEGTPKIFKPLVNAFWSELATLGFIGALAFLMTYNFNPECKDVCSVMQQISEHFLGEPMELQEVFEELHFLLFAVSVMFILAVLLMLRASLLKAGDWHQWEFLINHSSSEKSHESPSSNSLAGAAGQVWSGTMNLVQTASFNLLPGSPKKGAALTSPTATGRPTGSAGVVSQDPTVEDLLGLHQATGALKWYHGSFFEMWFKPGEENRQEYYRIRHRFIEDPNNFVETDLKHDFDFGHYLKLTLAHSCAHIIEIHPADWFILWLAFAGLFGTYYCFPDNSLMIFFLAEALMVLYTIWIQGHLVAIRLRLIPSSSRTCVLVHTPETAPLLLIPDTGDSDSAPASLLGLPPFLVKKQRPVANSGFFSDKKTNPHERLFFLGRRGPAFLMHSIKLLLFGSVIMLAVLFVKLWSEVLAIGAWLLVLAVLSPLFVVSAMPQVIQTFNMVTSIETMKREVLLIEVVKHQKHEKQKKALHVLSTLQFFLDQAEMLMGSGGGQEGSNSPADTSKSPKDRDVKTGFNALMHNPQTREMLDGLQDLFSSFDSDHSGNIDREELGGLLLAMGQHKNEDEVDRLFNMMDADGSGDVDFEEFATVIMSHNTSKKHVDPEDLANRMWSLFDQNGDGWISPDEMIATFQRIGKNWDVTEIQQFLHNIDEDKSGTIEKQEFVGFVNECFGGHSHKH